MLTLSRNTGERVRITTPRGAVIWLTMQPDWIDCDDGSGLEPLRAIRNNSALFKYEDGEVEIVYMPKRLKQHHHRVGIIAPKSFLILREELIDE
jgi:sRNA-binding carbon storage regulator CsrA